MDRRIVVALSALLAGAILAPGSAADGNNPAFSLPLACKVGTDCWVQNLVDMRAGKGVRDPFCGGAAFDNHKGTDIRVRTLAELKKGISILAMAPGKIVALRDGMADHLVENQSDVRRIQNKECGNGVIVRHKGNWTTQFCHMEQGSVVVKKGQRVKRGQVLGRMGLSGHTTFPHIHVTVRKGKQVIDPLTGQPQSKGCSTSATLDSTLWNDAAAAQVTGPSTAILAAGFSGGPVKRNQAMKNQVEPMTAAGPLIFYANAINLKKGDRLALKVTGPKGEVVNSEGEPVATPKATWTSYAGRRGKIATGTYRGRANLVRAGKVIAQSDEIIVEM